jgi:outer membrane protein assembly factor BamB
MNRYTRSILLSGFFLLFSVRFAAAESSREILTASGVQGGLIVHIGCGDPARLAEFRASDRYVVHALDTDAGAVHSAREQLLAAGAYGPVAVSIFGGQRLPHIDNLVNLVVAEDSGRVPMTEVLRVLAPLGVAYVKHAGEWEKRIKLWPDDIDQWTHYLHGPDNNAVAKDTVVAPPEGLQWVGGPLWSRAHSTLNGTSCMASARGRIFTIEDRAPIELPLLPGKYTLVARDAFNGIELWKRRLENWENISHWMKANPVQLPRRLVAVDDRVYVTLGIFAPVTALDAATGETIRVYDGTEKTQEILVADGVLYAVTGDPMNAYGWRPSFYRSDYRPYGEENYGPLREAKDAPETVIAAIDADSGRCLWRKSGDEVAGYQGTTLAVHGSRLVFQTQSDLVCLDRTDGHVLWRKTSPIVMGPKEGQKGRHWPFQGASPTLVLRDDVILRADAHQLVAFSTRNGAELWRTPTTITYHSSPDIFVVGSTVWLYPGTDGFDVETGKVVATRRVTRDGPMGHDRCYRNKATIRYMINSRSGGADFSRFGGDESRSHPWVRGTCSLGVMACNGLLYASPNACSCVNETKLYGFFALHGRPANLSSTGNCLEKGPARATATEPPPTPPSQEQWPTYRGDAARSGTAPRGLPEDMAPLWTVAIPNPTAPVIGGGRVLVAAGDAHTLYSLDSATGETVWTWIARGRIDSPPTYAEGRVVFGTAHGWVTCLDAETGQLAWRFRAAPSPALTVAFGQPESVWPVHGSVLVLDGTVYAVAGRQSFLDGGKQPSRAARFRSYYLQASKSSYVQDWQQGVPFNGKAMLKAGDLLYIAGTPVEFPADDLYRAVEGRAGGVLAVVSTMDGSTLKTRSLDAPPVWDGMAAANNCLLISLANGHVQCWAASTPSSFSCPRQCHLSHLPTGDGR